MNRFACHQFEIGQRVLLKNGLLFAQFPDQFTDADDLRRVQADRGLIQNDQLRAAQKSLRNAHALAVALGYEKAGKNHS